MAVIEELPGIEATVEVDGAALQEYKDDSIQGKPHDSTRYIEAQTGKDFSIRVKVAQGVKDDGAGVILEFYVNGQRTRRWVFAWETCEDKDRTIYSSALREPGIGYRNFRFSELDILEDAPRAQGEEKKRLKDLGLIQVKVFHAASIQEIEPQEESDSSPRRKKTKRPVKTVAEKDAKGETLSHTIEYSELIPDSPPKAGGKAAPWYDYKLTEPKVVDIFNFHYRSLKALKSQLIIPRSPSPEPLENRDPSTWSQDEMRAVLAENKALKDAATKIKRERQDDDEGRPRKRARPSGEIEVIELDSD